MITGSFEDLGFVAFREAIPERLIDGLLDRYLELVAERCQQRFGDANGADLAEYFDKRPDLESDVYGAIREKSWLSELCLDAAITAPIRSILGDDCGLLSKVVFRIDLPLWVREMALWHQDFRYVRGSTRTVTAWIPLQDTSFVNGCLSVMPRSHHLGVLPHDLQIGKRHLPGGIYDREIRLIELRKGDMLVFDSLLLHSSNVNFSDSIRYSIQARYVPLSDQVDPGMGAAIPVAGSRSE